MLCCIDAALSAPATSSPAPTSMPVVPSRERIDRLPPPRTSVECCPSFAAAASRSGRSAGEGRPPCGGLVSVRSRLSVSGWTGITVHAVPYASGSLPAPNLAGCCSSAIVATAAKSCRRSTSRGPVVHVRRPPATRCAIIVGASAAASPWRKSYSGARQEARCLPPGAAAAWVSCCSCCGEVYTSRLRNSALGVLFWVGMAPLSMLSALLEALLRTAGGINSGYRRANGREALCSTGRLAELIAR